MSKSINPKRFPILDADDGQTLGEVGSANGVDIPKGGGEQTSRIHDCLASFTGFYLLSKKESVSAQKRCTCLVNQPVQHLFACAAL